MTIQISLNASAQPYLRASPDSARRPAEESELISKTAGIRLLFILTAVVAVAGLLLPPIPQPQSYHVFADGRSFLGIPNFADVVSNLPFAVVGVCGLVFLSRSGPVRNPQQFIDAWERLPYFVIFAGLLLTAVGSSYYHLHPDNTRLVWDRLPMTIVFMSLVSATIAERVSLRAGLWLLPALLLLGLGSVLQWHLSELRGAGDLRFYSAVQAYSVLFLLIALLLPARYTRGSDLVMVAGFYVLAKLFELLDKPIFRSHTAFNKRAHLKASRRRCRRVLDSANVDETASTLTSCCLASAPAAYPSRRYG